MLIGTPKEIKIDEYRVGLVPATIRALAAQGHKVLVQTHSGEGAGISDEEYAAAGAEILPGAEPIFANAELIVKVKEPLGPERQWLRRGQIIFTYLHLAADPELARDLMTSGATAIAYETVTDTAGKLPLLSPMSRIAGQMAPQVAGHFLERPKVAAAFSSAKWTVFLRLKFLFLVVGSSVPMLRGLHSAWALMSVSLFAILRWSTS